MRDINFIGFNVQTTFSEIIASDLGVVDGIESIFGFPTGDMVSARWASTLKQQRILNPHLILRDVAMDPTLMLDDTGVALLDGSVHHLVVVDNDVSPITLWVNRTTGWINKLTFMENEPVHRDVEIEVLYYGWTPTTGGGLLFPSDVYIAMDGVILHEETRSSIQVNPSVSSDLFAFPTGSMPAYDANDAHRGEANHQFHQLFASIGIPLDAEQTFVNPIELSPGVYYVTGGSHHSLLVEQSNRLVLVEAPLDQGRCEAILAWTAATFPNKPISHVIATHHHSDHIGGIRTIAAEGAIAVVGEAGADFFKGIFAAPSTIYPDNLALSPVAVTIEPVLDGGSFTLPDATNPLTAYQIANPHAADMLIIHVPSANVVFNSDMLNTGVPVTIFPPFMASGIALFNAITGIGIASPSLVMAGGHGAGTNTFAEFQAALGIP
jgi:glyoxylase-like metal-dependent hydrolase (beta-lactamase superfamily II)